ncbi:MAG: hypothetical protein V4498_00275 [candidate division FCPU426 bacterium]
MAVPFITAKSFAAGKREATWGTQLAPAAADFNVRIRDVSFDPQTEMYLTPFQSGRHSFSEPVPGKRMCGVKFKVDMRCGASAGTAPKMGKFFEAAGQLETVILTFSGPLVTSNVINGTVNGVALTPITFAVDSATTLGAIKDAVVAALAGLGTAITATGVVSGNTIRITRTTVNTSVALTAFVVTLGAGQVTASYSVVYNPQGGNDPTTATILSMDAASLSAGFYFTPPSGNSLIVSVKGAMFNCKVMMDDLGQPLYAEFDGKGCLVGIADGSTIALTSPDTSIPPAVLGVAITLNSVVQRIGKFELDFGNDIQLKYDPADTTGYLAAYIAKREPRLRYNPQTTLLATDPVYTRWVAGAAYVFSLATATSSSIKWTIGAAKAVLLTLKPAERNGEAIWEQEHQLIETSGNDEFSITQSA